MTPFGQELPFRRRAHEEGQPDRGDSRRIDEAIRQSEDVLHRRLGEELEYARRMLDVTGERLCADPVTVARHLVALQSLDIIGQTLGHLANVIRSDNPQSATEHIGMGDLKARLTRNGAL